MLGAARWLSKHKQPDDAALIRNTHKLTYQTMMKPSSSHSPSPRGAFVPANVEAARVAPVEAGSTGARPAEWLVRRAGVVAVPWRSRPTLCPSFLRRESRRLAKFSPSSPHPLFLPSFVRRSPDESAFAWSLPARRPAGAFDPWGFSEASRSRR